MAGTENDMRVVLPEQVVHIWNLGAVGTITLEVCGRQSSALPGWRGAADACLSLPAVGPQCGVIRLPTVIAHLAATVAGERLSPLWGEDEVRDGVPWRTRRESFQSDLGWRDAVAQAEQWGRREVEHVIEALAQRIDMLRAILAAARESPTVVARPTPTSRTRLRR